ncbi:hypothetical protein D3C78_928220 [compost metagenome]
MLVPLTLATAVLLSSFWNGGLINTMMSAAARTTEAIIQPLLPLGETGGAGGVVLLLLPTLFITGILSSFVVFTGSSAATTSTSFTSLVFSVVFNSSSGVPLFSKFSFPFRSFLSIISNDSLQYRCCLSIYNFNRNPDPKP